MAKGQGFFDRINRYQLDPELLMAAMDLIADRPPEDRDFEGQTIAIVRFVHERDDIPAAERSDAGLAINFRLMALAKLDLLPMPEWRIVAGCKSDPDLLHEDVLRVAAIEPLVRVGEDLIFDRDSFTKRLAIMTTRSMASHVRETAGVRG